jgi:hypothetical protein
MLKIPTVGRRSRVHRTAAHNKKAPIPALRDGNGAVVNIPILPSLSYSKQRENILVFGHILS